MRTRFDWFHFDDNDTEQTDSVDQLPSNRFRLNLKADVSENMIFRGRLVVFKNWGDNDIPSYPTLSSMNASRTRTDTTVKVERAYVDYFFGGTPLALSFGRLPFTDGLPTDLREDTPRKSTYPSLAYDVEADGIALSYGLEGITTLPSSSAKLIYTRTVNDNDDQIYMDNALGIEGMDVYLLQFETGFPGAMEGTLFILNYIYVPEMRSPDLTSLGLTPTSLPESIGSFHKYTFFLESKRFMGSLFDWFLGYSIIKTKADDLAIYDTGAPAPFNEYPVGILNDDGTSDRTGTAFQLGVRANLPFKGLNEPKFGVEYNKGSKYWVGMSMAAEDPLHKLDTRGDAWDIYYIQPFSRYFSARVGYTMIHYDYSGSGSYYGTPLEADQDVTNAYFLIEARF